MNSTIMWTFLQFLWLCWRQPRYYPFWVQCVGGCAAAPLWLLGWIYRPFWCPMLHVLGWVNDHARPEKRHPKCYPKREERKPLGPISQAFNLYLRKRIAMKRETYFSLWYQAEKMDN